MRTACGGLLLRRGCLLLALVAAVGSSCGRPSSEQRHARPGTAREDEIRRSPVSSSALRSVGYDQEQQTLEIEFQNGAVYRYFDVPAKVHRGLMGAESHGRYFHEHVRSKGYRYERLN